MTKRHGLGAIDHRVVLSHGSEGQKPEIGMSGGRGEQALFPLKPALPSPQLHLTAANL